MDELKRIPAAAVPAALEKALRYRLLNEPWEAESICRDVLDIDPENHSALVTLVLALTDQFETRYVDALNGAHEVVSRLDGEYDREYYSGIINERWAKAQLAKGVPGHVALGWLQKAMRCFDHAQALSPADNPDAVLRWNACARFLEENSSWQPSAQITVEADFGDEVPPR